MNPDEALQTVRRSVLEDADFVRLTLAEPAQGGEVPLPHAPEGGPWLKVSVRPVELRGERMWQFSFFDGRKDVAKNRRLCEASEALEALLPRFRRAHVQTASGDLHLRVTKKGKVLASRGKPSARAEPDLRHNRAKRQPLPAERPDPFLMAIGVMDRRGRVKPTMQGKFRQINEFLRQMEQVLRPGPGPVRLVDCGCGSAWLTFAAWRHVTGNLGRPALVEGVDADEELVAKCLRLRDTLGWRSASETVEAAAAAVAPEGGDSASQKGGLDFSATPIRDYAPKEPPDCVVSLHACDTATDEAIAGAVRWGARAVLAAPCCQHELRPLLRAPGALRPLLRHGILKDRLADLLTDAFRALALRVMGYRVQVIEFADPEHTAKNLLIRAEKTGAPGRSRAAEEWKALEGFCGAAPAIRALLGEEFEKALGTWNQG